MAPTRSRNLSFTTQSTRQDPIITLSYYRRKFNTAYLLSRRLTTIKWKYVMASTRNRLERIGLSSLNLVTIDCKCDRQNCETFSTIPRLLRVTAQILKVQEPGEQTQHSVSPEQRYQAFTHFTNNKLLSFPRLSDSNTSSWDILFHCFSHIKYCMANCVDNWEL